MPDRRTPFQNLPEREQLVAFLDYLRESVVVKASGLSDEDAARPMVPSGTSLLWLLKHLVEVDAYWFHSNFAGEPDMPSDPGDDVASVIEAYRRVCARSNEIVMACDDLDALAAVEHGKAGARSLRWILVHMIEETGRHAGHADIIRELIDGEVGR